MEGIIPATTADLPELVALINRAYRGEDSRRGWCSEADLIQGNMRTDLAEVTEHYQRPNARFLKYTDAAGVIQASVFLEVRGRELYLGMLSVNPDLQARGIGRQLVQAGETLAREAGCQSVVMQVLSARQELLAWYQRQGYQLTGESRPFTVDPQFGIARIPLEFVFLSKLV